MRGDTGRPPDSNQYSGCPGLCRRWRQAVGWSVDVPARRRQQMSEEFWSHCAWPLATAVLGFLYTGLVFRQWLKRRQPHQAAWTIGLLFYAVAAVMEAWSEYQGRWDPLVY